LIETDLVRALAVAVGIGLLIGLERERRKGDGPQRAAAGLRTFTLVALLGAMSSATGLVWLVVAAAGGVAVLASVSYQRSRDADPGLTTEVALLVTYVIGVLTTSLPAIAAGLGIITAILLGFREPLHRFAVARLSEREWRDAVLLAAAALIVLPLLPNRPIDPWGLLNLHVVWRLTVLVMAINAVGYVALRVLGARWGLPLSGLLGGFVSSAAVIAAMGQRSRDDARMVSAAVAGAALSSVATGLQLAIVLALTNPQLLSTMQPQLLAFVLIAAGYGAAVGWRSLQASESGPALSGRAFDPRTAFIVACLFAGMLLIVGVLNRQFGASGALAGAVVGGFLDAHAAAGSVATLAQEANIPQRTGEWGVVLAVTANSVTKIVLAAITGGWRYCARLAPSLIAMAGALWIGLLLG